MKNTTQTPKRKAAVKKQPPTAMDKLDKIGVDAICEKIIGGETLTAISKGVGVSVAWLLAWCNKDGERSARVREARITSARSWDDKAEIAISEATDQFTLSRARELAQHYRWRASKIAPKDYGDKLAIGGADDLPPIKQDVTISPEEAYKRLLEGE